MPWQSFLVTIGALVPAPVLIVVNLWFGLFRGTYIAHPAFAGALEQTASAFGVMLTIVLFVRFRTASTSTRTKIFYVSFVCFLGAFVCCLFLRYLVREATTQSDVESLVDVWAAFYFMFLTSIVSSIVSFALLQKK